MRNLLQRRSGRIHDPDRRRVSAAMLTPTARSGIGHDVGTVGDALAVRRPAALDGDGLHDFLLIASVEGDLVKLTAPAVGDLAIGHEQHSLAVHAPSGHDIGRRVPRQSPWLAALHRNHIDVDVVVVIRGKRNPPAIGREVRRKLGGRVRCELDGMPAVAVADPDVAAIDEGQMILRHRRLPQQPSRRILRSVRGEAPAYQNDRARLPQDTVKPHISPDILLSVVCRGACRTLANAPARCTNYHGFWDPRAAAAWPPRSARHALERPCCGFSPAKRIVWETGAAGRWARIAGVEHRWRSKQNR